MERRSKEQLLFSYWLQTRTSWCLVVTMTLSGYGVDHNPHGLGRVFPPLTAWAVTCHHRAGHPLPAFLQRIQQKEH